VFQEGLRARRHWGFSREPLSRISDLFPAYPERPVQAPGPEQRGGGGGAGVSLDMLELRFGEGQEARAFISVLLSMMATSQKENEGGDDDEAGRQQAD